MILHLPALVDSTIDTNTPPMLYVIQEGINCTLQNQITSEVDKYLQEAVERCERDVNYFDGWHVATNTSNSQQKADFIEHDEEKVPESNSQDTGENGAKNAEHNIQYHDELETIPEEEEDEDP